MSFDLAKVKGYGSGSLGDITDPVGLLNYSASVTAISSSNITLNIGNASYYSAGSSSYTKDFVEGQEIMVHVSASKNSSAKQYLGIYMFFSIKSVSGSVLTLDGDFTSVFPSSELANYYVQALTVPHFRNLTLNPSCIISPVQYNTSYGYGGIVVLKVSDTLDFNGGSINTENKGIPSSSYRPLTTQDSYESDTSSYSGWENHITARNFLLNSGNGAVFIVAKKISFSDSSSRIGGTSAGAQFSRGNAGGASILIASETIENFSPSSISTKKGSGAGLGRCYIASETKLRNDEGLYAYDCISKPKRVVNVFNIRDFGNGELGTVINPTAPLNNYAGISSIDSTGKIISCTDFTTNGMSPFVKNAKVIFHVSKHRVKDSIFHLGRFFLTTISSVDSNIITISDSVKK